MSRLRNRGKMISKAECISLKSENSLDMPYLVYLPEDEKSREFPAILYLHGKGERGDDCAALRNVGLPKYLEDNPIPFIVFAPQCPVDSEWIFHLDTLAQFIKKLGARYNVDNSRIYLTGSSMGGIGAWHLAVKYPDMFAAIIPICGAVYPFLGYPEAVTRLKDVPIWVFHGMEDDVVPIQLAKDIIDTLLRVNGKIRFTFYKKTGHDAWTRTYGNREIYDWMLQNRNTNVLDIANG